MKGWELFYEGEVLNEALECNVEIFYSDEKEIIACVDGFKIDCPIVFKTPHQISCTCDLKKPCKHEAALMYYLEKHLELLENTSEISKLINLADENQLRKFLISEINQNPELKNHILTEFGSEELDKEYYLNKLGKVFRSGEDRDFVYHEIYNLDMMALGLSEFMENEITKLLNAGEHSFAVELLEKIADLLSDDLSVSHDSWYDLAEEFMEYYYILIDSIYLTENEMESFEKSVRGVGSYL